MTAAKPIKLVHDEAVQPPGVMALLDEARAKITGMEELVIEIARLAYSLGVKDGAAQQRRVGT